MFTDSPSFDSSDQDRESRVLSILARYEERRAQMRRLAAAVAATDSDKTKTITVREFAEQGWARRLGRDVASFLFRDPYHPGKVWFVKDVLVDKHDVPTLFFWWVDHFGRHRDSKWNPDLDDQIIIVFRLSQRGDEACS